MSRSTAPPTPATPATLARPRRLHRRRHGGVAREGRPAHRPGRPFNDSDRPEVDGDCVFVRVQRKSSGVGDAAARRRLARRGRQRAAAGRLVAGVERVGRRSSTSGCADQGEPADRPPTAKPFMLTPLVIAMPRPMAEALGWPDTPDRLRRHPRAGPGPDGLGRQGPSRVGRRSGSARPTPTSRPAGCRPPSPSTTRPPARPAASPLEDLARPEVDAFARGVESSVVHYGDITLTFLNNWYRNDRAGHGAHLRVGGGRRGEVGHRLQPRQPRRHPRPRRAAAAAAGAARGDLPEGGHALLRQPVLRARRAVGRRPSRRRRRAPFERVRAASPTNQRRVLRVRLPARQPRRSPSAPRSTPANGVDPDQPQNVARACPTRRCWSRLLDLWAEQRKAARVLLVIDVSGSMGDRRPTTGRHQARPGQAGGGRRARPVQGRRRRRPAHLLHRPQPGPSRPTTSTSCPIGADRRATASRSRRRSAASIPTQGTPLYTVAQALVRRDAARRTTRPASTPSCCSPTAERGPPQQRPRRACSPTLRSRQRGPVDPAGAALPHRLRPGRRPRHVSSASPRPPTPPPTTPATPRRSTRSSPPSSATSEP